MIQIIKNKIGIKRIFIKNIDKPICKNCIYYHEHKDFILPSKCKKFGEINIVSGEIEYLFAYTCRKLNYYCGIDGKYYEKHVIIEEKNEN